MSGYKTPRCNSCDHARPYEYIEDSAVYTSDTRIECLLFKDEDGKHLVISKRAGGCLSHEPKSPIGKEKKKSRSRTTDLKGRSVEEFVSNRNPPSLKEELAFRKKSNCAD